MGDSSVTFPVTVLSLLRHILNHIDDTYVADIREGRLFHGHYSYAHDPAA